MDYIEIAKGSPKNRGSLILKKDLLRHLDKNIPLYRSIYLYDKSAYEFAEATGSLKNYFGKRGIDHIILDVDKGDSSNEHTRQKAIGIVVNLKSLIYHKTLSNVIFLALVTILLSQMLALVLHLVITFITVLNRL